MDSFESLPVWTGELASVEDVIVGSLPKSTPLSSCFISLWNVVSE